MCFHAREMHDLAAAPRPDSCKDWGNAPSLQQPKHSFGIATLAPVRAQPTAARRFSEKGGAFQVQHTHDAGRDGVATAGKRTVRVGPRAVAHSDPGLLDGHDRGSRGEAAQHWTRQGASSGAPAQDHYTYEVGARVTDMEFPLGKKLFPTWP